MVEKLLYELSLWLNIIWCDHFFVIIIFLYVSLSNCLIFKLIGIAFYKCVKRTYGLTIQYSYCHWMRQPNKNNNIEIPLNKFGTFVKSLVFWSINRRCTRYRFTLCVCACHRILIYSTTKCCTIRIHLMLMVLLPSSLSSPKKKRETNDVWII